VRGLSWTQFSPTGATAGTGTESAKGGADGQQPYSLAAAVLLFDPAEYGGRRLQRLCARRTPDGNTWVVRPLVLDPDVSAWETFRKTAASRCLAPAFADTRSDPAAVAGACGVPP